MSNQGPAVLTKIKDFLKEYPKAEWGPSHTVLSDDNLLDRDLLFAFKETYRELILTRSKDSEAELRATLDLLCDLADISETDRDPYPEDDQ